jgi:coproporphyrinogen III oxidase-like Fe-S oxidoreductase
MKILNDGLIKFDRQLPIYNWFYPLQFENITDLPSEQKLAIYGTLDSTKVRSRALYFHIPFCETICSFCPFIRGTYQGDEIVERYTQALIREIEWKARFASLCEVPVGSIFFGGGTPSVLSPEQILRIGEAIHKHYDLSQIKEFAFEMEVKSITRDKVAALREIGVTHARFGLQTFNPFYRDLFTLSATLDQIYTAVELLLAYMPYTSFDILYGMNGQTQEDFIKDLQQAIALGTQTIDVYPVDNIATQIKLHRASEEAGLAPQSALNRFSMNVLLNEYMRTMGFLPHNGHGYVRAPQEELSKRPIVSDYYSFEYHEHVYGYDDREVIGFGVSAISSLNGYTITNLSSREKYMKQVLEKGIWDVTLSKHDRAADASKGVILHLPYHGFVEKAKIRWDAVHPDTLRALGELIDAGLVKETSDRYELTQVGWYWYVNVMCYLIPKPEQRLLNRFIAEKLKEPGRKMTVNQVMLFA